MLKTDFKDEILQQGKLNREYDLVKEDGTIIESKVHLVRKDTPLQVGDNYGAKEINELNSEVNDKLDSTYKPDWSEINNKPNMLNYKLKGDFVLLTGTIKTPPANNEEVMGSTTIVYPSGYTRDNCVVISVMASPLYDVQKGNWFTTSLNNAIGYMQGNGTLTAALKPEGIVVSVMKSSAVEPTTTRNIRVVLMKTGITYQEVTQ